MKLSACVCFLLVVLCSFLESFKIFSFCYQLTDFQKLVPFCPPLHNLKVVKKQIKKLTTFPEIRSLEAKINVGKAACKKVAVELQEITHLASKKLSIPAISFLQLKYQRIPKFTRSLFSLTAAKLVEEGKLEEPPVKIAEKLNNLSKLIVHTGKMLSHHASSCTTKNEAIMVHETGIQRINSIIEKNVKVINNFRDMRNELGKIPVIDPFLSTVCVVGLQKVGKSELVKCLTKIDENSKLSRFNVINMNLGKISCQDKKYNENSKFCGQILDTFGLNFDEFFREIEEESDPKTLTMAALKYLPCAVVYCFDISHSSEFGNDEFFNEQLFIRSLLRKKFSSRPWIDVITKGDKSSTFEVKKYLEKFSEFSFPFIFLSSRSGYGINFLSQILLQTFDDLSIICDKWKNYKNKV